MKLPRLLPAAVRAFARPLSASFLLAAAATPAAQAAPVAASRAHDFVDSVGVNVHAMASGPYSSANDWAVMKSALQTLGVRHIRDGVRTDGPDWKTFYTQMGALGIRSTVIFGYHYGGPGVTPNDTELLLNRLVGAPVTAFAAFEGVNEPNIQGNVEPGGPGQWTANTRTWTIDLWNNLKSNSAYAAYKDLPVYGPSPTGLDDGAAFTSLRAAFPDLESYVTHGNFHPYAGGREPEKVLAEEEVRARKGYVSRPLAATETGYHEVNPTPDTEKAVAVYLPRTSLEAFRLGYARTFHYELFDSGDNRGEVEHNFGLFRRDGVTLKPAGVALKNLLSLLADSGGASFAPGPLDYTLTSGNSNLRSLLLAKQDGSHWLAVWSSDYVWEWWKNPRAYRDAPDFPATLTFNEPVTQVKTYSPTYDTNVVTTYSAPSSISLSVTERVLLLEIRRGGFGNGHWRIKSRRSGKALDVSGASSANGASVILWSPHSGDNQKWKIESVGGGYYRLIAKHSGKALDVAGISTTNGAFVHQWEYVGNQNQQWKVEPVGGGYYRLIARHSNKALDLKDGSLADGARVQQWEYYPDNLNQQWSLETAP